MSPEVIWNESDDEHADKIRQLLTDALRFDCAVAFFKVSGYNAVKGALTSFLRSGGQARFFIGLDFCLTEPDALENLLDLQRQHRLELYCIDNGGECTFHPKVYHFEYKGRCESIIGSANLTAGGLGDNYECSVRFDSIPGSCVSNLLTRFLAEEKLDPFDGDALESYRRKHAIAKMARAREKRIARRIETAERPSSILREVLIEFRSDVTQDGFDAQARRRARAAKEARRLMKAMTEPRSDQSIREQILELRRCFHSNIVPIFTTSLARRPTRVRRLAREALAASGRSPEVAYEAMSGIDLTGIGPNWISEMLHAVDPSRFAVLNQNSADGMLSVRSGFPRRPTKSNITAARYAEFCEAAVELSKELGLKNLSELDAVFNRAYFS